MLVFENANTVENNAIVIAIKEAVDIALIIIVSNQFCKSTTTKFEYTLVSNNKRIPSYEKKTLRRYSF
ncbi:MAG: hypothetical protein Kapaf2KO_16520 [Candidatus Kapaibacteriales bacterium]